MTVAIHVIHSNEPILVKGTEASLEEKIDAAKVAVAPGTTQFYRAWTNDHIVCEFANPEQRRAVHIHPQWITHFHEVSV